MEFAGVFFSGAPAGAEELFSSLISAVMPQMPLTNVFGDDSAGRIVVEDAVSVLPIVGTGSVASSSSSSSYYHDESTDTFVFSSSPFSGTLFFLIGIILNLVSSFFGALGDTMLRRSFIYRKNRIASLSSEQADSIMEVPDTSDGEEEAEAIATESVPGEGAAQSLLIKLPSSSDLCSTLARTHFRSPPLSGTTRISSSSRSSTIHDAVIIQEDVSKRSLADDIAASIIGTSSSVPSASPSDSVFMDSDGISGNTRRPTSISNRISSWIGFSGRWRSSTKSVCTEETTTLCSSSIVSSPSPQTNVCPSPVVSPPSNNLLIPSSLTEILIQGTSVLGTNSLQSDCGAHDSLNDAYCPLCYGKGETSALVSPDWHALGSRSPSDTAQESLLGCCCDGIDVDAKAQRLEKEISSPPADLSFSSSASLSFPCLSPSTSPSSSLVVESVEKMSSPSGCPFSIDSDGFLLMSSCEYYTSMPCSHLGVRSSTSESDPDAIYSEASMALGSRASATVPSVWKDPHWLAGMFMSAVMCPVFNVGAMEFLPASVVGFAGVQILFVMLLARHWLREEVSVWNFTGAVFVIVGLLLVSLYSGSDPLFYSVSGFLEYFASNEAIIYLSITGALMFFGLWYYLDIPSPSHRCWSCSSIRGCCLRMQRIMLPSTAGLFGGYAVLGAKAMMMAITAILTARHNSWKHVLSEWRALFLILLTIVFALMELLFINRSLQMYEVVAVVPIVNSVITLTSAIGGIMLFEEYPTNPLLWTAGLILIIAGVTTLSYGNVMAAYIHQTGRNIRRFHIQYLTSYRYNNYLISTCNIQTNECESQHIAQTEGEGATAETGGNYEVLSPTFATS